MLDQLIHAPCEVRQKMLIYFIFRVGMYNIKYYVSRARKCDTLLGPQTAHSLVIGHGEQSTILHRKFQLKFISRLQNNKMSHSTLILYRIVFHSIIPF